MVRYYLIGLFLLLSGCAINDDGYEVEVDGVDYEKFHYYDFETYEWKNVYYEEGEK